MVGMTKAYFKYASQLLSFPAVNVNGTAINKIQKCIS